MQMSITGLVLTILIIVLGIFDLVLVLIQRDSTRSVSDYLVRAGFKRPMVIASFSYVLGHLWGGMYPEQCPPPSANILAPNFWMWSFILLAVAYVVLWRKDK